MSHQERFFLTSPHSGEKVPTEVFWLKNLDEVTLMFDVDRYVDELYENTALKLKIPFLKSQWHRYFSDANRLPDDVDEGSVIGSPNKKGKFTTGLIWQSTSQGHVLLKAPITKELYQLLVNNYYQEFHDFVLKQYQNYFNLNSDPVFQLDLHSMPSMGTQIHRDPGQKRAQIVVSDQNGKSAHPKYVELVVESYKKAGFDVAYNWPYIGGRVTETYGKPENNQHCVQVELRRDLYMNESTKKKNLDLFSKLQTQLASAINSVFNNLNTLDLKEKK
jgi:N-formylglutamate deformylase